MLLSLGVDLLELHHKVVQARQCFPSFAGFHLEVLICYLHFTQNQLPGWKERRSRNPRLAEIRLYSDIHLIACCYRHFFKVFLFWCSESMVFNRTKVMITCNSYSWITFTRNMRLVHLFGVFFSVIVVNDFTDCDSNQPTSCGNNEGWSLLRLEALFCSIHLQYEGLISILSTTEFQYLYGVDSTLFYR